MRKQDMYGRECMRLWCGQPQVDTADVMDARFARET